jgi:hypothetical protein
MYFPFHSFFPPFFGPTTSYYTPLRIDRPRFYVLSAPPTPCTSVSPWFFPSGIIFYIEDRSSSFLRTIDEFSSHYVALHPRIDCSSLIPTCRYLRTLLDIANEAEIKLVARRLLYFVTFRSHEVNTVQYMWENVYNCCFQSLRLEFVSDNTEMFLPYQRIKKYLCVVLSFLLLRFYCGKHTSAFIWLSIIVREEGKVQESKVFLVLN